MALRVEMVSGDKQAVGPGISFQPLVISYRDLESGEPAPGTPVDFMIIDSGQCNAQFESGGQELATSTDLAGFATATVVAGPSAGEFRVEAMAEVDGPRPLVRAGYVFCLSVEDHSQK